MTETTASTHWAAQKERGSFLGLKFTAIAVRLLGRRAVTPVTRLIVLYFFITGAAARRNVREYQRRLATWSGRADLFQAGLYGRHFIGNAYISGPLAPGLRARLSGKLQNSSAWQYRPSMARVTRPGSRIAPSQS